MPDKEPKLIETVFQVLRPGAPADSQTVMLPKEPGYKLLQAIFGGFVGGTIEHVSVLHEGKPADMFVEGDGRLKGFPRNHVATAIYRNNWLTRYPDTPPETLDWIAGTAVLLGRRVWF